MIPELQFYRLLPLICIVFLMHLSHISRAQYKQGDVWVLGYDSNGHTTEVEGTILDFSSGILQVYPEEIAISLYYSNSSLSDKNGKLMFYTNGAKLSNGAHEIIEDTICPGEKYEQNSFFGYPQRDGTLLVDSSDFADHHNLFFLDYSTTSTDTSVEYYSSLKHWIINPNQIISNDNSSTLYDTLVYGLLSCTRHKDNIDWWILIWKGYEYYPISLLISGSQVTKTILGSPVDYPPSINLFAGIGSFSPKGNKYARYSAAHACVLFDFDRETGQLFNHRSWVVDDKNYSSGRISFSPSGRFLYLSNGAKLFQYDTEAADVSSSEILIAEWDEFMWQGLFSTAFNVHKNTPDCRIFISTAGTTPYLHVIHHPDEKGAACGFEMRGIELPWPHDRGLPNIPNYRLGTPEENYCDSIKVNTNELIRGWLPAISPNPVSDQLRIVWPQSVDMQIIHIVDMQGRIIHRERPGRGSREQLISSEGWNSGTYIVELIAADGSRVVRKIVKD